MKPNNLIDGVPSSGGARIIELWGFVRAYLARYIRASELDGDDCEHVVAYYTDILRKLATGRGR